MPVLIVDMYKDFLTIVRKSRVGTVLPLEFSTILNLATEEVISNKIDNFDTNKKFAIQLLPITVGPYLVVGVWLEEWDVYRYKTFTIDLPKDCRLITKLVIEVVPNNEGKCNPLSLNEQTTILNGIYSKPTPTNCYYNLQNLEVNGAVVKKVFIYAPYSTSGTGYPKLRMNYVINPPVISEMDTTNSSESIFDKEVCSEIVTVASRMYLEGIQDSRYPTFNNELKFKH
jgi:hypothetical protein